MTVRIPLVHRIIGFFDSCLEVLGEAVSSFAVCNTEIQGLQCSAGLCCRPQ